MRIDNRTHWRTDQIRPILRRISHMASDKLGRRLPRTVTLKYHRSMRGFDMGVGGYDSSRTGSDIVLTLPKQQPPPPADLALALYELVFRVDSIPRVVTPGRRASWWADFSWAIPLKIEKQPPAPALKATLKKLDAAWRSLKAAERKRKLYTTLTKKWQRRIKAYEKKLGKGEPAHDVPVLQSASDVQG